MSAEIEHLLHSARMVLDRAAEGRSVQAEAAAVAQRIVDVIGHDPTDEEPARVATLPLDWQSRDGCDWFPRMDGTEVCLRLNSDGSVTWFEPDDESSEAPW